MHLVGFKQFLTFLILEIGVQCTHQLGWMILDEHYLGLEWYYHVM